MGNKIGICFDELHMSEGHASMPILSTCMACIYIPKVKVFYRHKQFLIWFYKCSCRKIMQMCVLVSAWQQEEEKSVQEKTSLCLIRFATANQNVQTNKSYWTTLGFRSVHVSKTPKCVKTNLLDQSYNWTKGNIRLYEQAQLLKIYLEALILLFLLSLCCWKFWWNHEVGDMYVSMDTSVPLFRFQ
jgi:hypothetical protein